MITRVSYLVAVAAILLSIGAGSTPSDDDVLVRIDGRPLVLGEYKDHLYRSFGRSELTGFVDAWLVERRARELGVVLDAESARREAKREIARQVEFRFGGDLDRFQRELASRGTSVEQYEEDVASRMATDVLVDQCLLAEREIGPDQVVAKFEELFGVGGVYRVIRHILLLQDRDRAAQVFPDRGADPRSAMSLGRELLARLREDRSLFEDFVERYTDDEKSRSVGGRMTLLGPGSSGFGQAFEEAVTRLDAPLEIAGPIDSDAGVHLVQLIETRVTRLDGVREEIRQYLATRPPTGPEREAFRVRLRRAARVEY